ncbi:timeless-domain-containing protein [Aureobasidium subglaciale]|nr:timeless-domain-containing protein [Aureobasidium subglaciale]KAI5219367.1 timeless-domain-containing protein [Aureobasidium subglaciale]KAI5222967.1 timeless-domain-containing protein [Aureobasidium subglaciale]KAI5260356.1 timeless-domain-containing protein [Aureobasidium subglaciale]
MEVFEKSQTVDAEVRAHVYSLVSAIGGSSTVNEGQYVLGDDALACLKDLSRWIRLYDDRINRHDVKRCMAEANLVRGDLLPILAQQGDKSDRSVLATKVALNCLDLLNTLTWPIERKEETMTINTHRHLPYIKLAQVEYKRAILHWESAHILRTAISVAIPAITQSRTERNPRDDSIIGVVLYFLRNIAIIAQPVDVPSQSDDNDINRLDTIHAFHQQNVLQLLLTIASSVTDEYPMHDIVLLEILFHLLKGIDPKDLFKNEKQLQDSRNHDFKALLDKEKAMNSSYARNAPSRHHRFGTMIWVKRPDEKVSTLSGQNVIFDEQKTMHQMDQSKLWNKPKPRKKNVEVQDENNDFDNNVILDEPTRKIVRHFTEDFLDSSFNPLFNSLRRALTSEAERAQKYNTRQYYYLMGWFLQAERARQDLLKRNGKVHDAAVDDSPFAYIAAVMTQENFILLGRKIQQSLDDKEWSDLHACMRAFTQILLTVTAMADSPSEDDQEIAENIQNRIFYEETTHDQVIAVLRGYNNQGFAFLDACTDMAHTFLRMLERYSKQNVDMQVRSKRRTRKKRKVEAQVNGADDEGAASEAEDQADAQRAVSERKFDFTRFASKFMTESAVNTFVRFTSYYKDLDTEQLKRCHRFFYRCAFKMERTIFLYRVDILHLFNRMIKGPEGLSKDLPLFKEWEELVKQVFRRCLKNLEQRRELMVEMLFTKIPNTIFYLENGYEMEITKARPRPPAELVVKPGLSQEQQIAVAVSVLVNQGKLDALAWVKDVLNSAAEERRAWEDLHDAQANLANDTNTGTNNNVDDENADSINNSDAEAAVNSVETANQEDKPKAPFINLKPDTDDRKLSLFKDKFLRLLLKLLSLDRLGENDDPDASWIVPSSMPSSLLLSNLALIKKFEFDLPTFEGGVAPESLLRSKSAAGLHARADRSAVASAVNSDDEGDTLSDLDDQAAALFEPGGPTSRPADYEKPRLKKRLLQRKAPELSEEERLLRAQERDAREREKNAKVKSALRITDSDDEDDAEKDAEFFALEEQRRKKISGVIRNALLNEVDDSAGQKGKRKAKATKEKTAKGKKRKTITIEDDSDGDGELASDAEMRDVSAVDLSSDAEEAPEDTPMDTVSPIKTSTAVVIDEDENEDEDDIVQARPARARPSARLPFSDDSDSD